MKSMGIGEALEIYKRVWSGMSITEATHDSEATRRSFYRFLEANALEPPKKGEIAKNVEKRAQRHKRITKKNLTNESLSNQIRKGVYANAEKDSSWGRVGISLLDLDSKTNTSTITPDEYRALIVDLFCGGKDPKKKKKA